jgi:hypothetical protein
MNGQQGRTTFGRTVKTLPKVVYLIHQNVGRQPPTTARPLKRGEESLLLSA